ncbi:MAG: PaaI family thioesterase [Armatimonadota bacterium]|nr:PaaI family thioesterase [Armatimonadota bacterium]MDR7436823.1 PaaI family thioesterase [Armatimonadota bacterium]MDR7472771.1 PaaI family thioesterase [Armatimonadota bacterium]MDR7507296.1 PaaI family thioesterase [Armatimonadota bacterium]MDR7508800.1 PaaI family thioesterase [Armatimonadota bacterium]
MDDRAVQDYYPESFAHCYGCGRLNPHGYHLRTTWDGEETVTRFTPHPYHTALPGVVYGGVIASLVDCHGTGSAAAAALRAEGREIGQGPAPRFVTAALRVEFRRPTPLGVPLEARGRIREMAGRKVVVEVRVLAGGEVTATGEVVAVRVPDGPPPPDSAP